MHAESHPAFHLEVPTSSSSVAAAAAAATAANTNNLPFQLQNHPLLTPYIGKVIEKEFCYARKDENRYKVARGTRFYRVKVRPRSPSSKCTDPTGRCCLRRERNDCNLNLALLNKKRHSLF